MPHVAAVTLDGPKGVGKTSTASRRAGDELRLDLEQHWRMARADPELVTRLPKPLLIDEWQRVPAVWGAVRRAVDDGADPGSYLLAGSACHAWKLRSTVGPGVSFPCEYGPWRSVNVIWSNRRSAWPPCSEGEQRCRERARWE